MRGGPVNISRRKELIELLKDKEYRDAFVSEHIDTGLPFQIKALREEREWSQEKLGSTAGMHQERISTLEDPNYAKFTLKTLKRLASAFDVALMVVFAPFSKLLDWESNLSPEALQAVSFDKDNFLVKDFTGEEKEKVVEGSITDKISPSQTGQIYLGYGGIVKSFLPEAGALKQAFKSESSFGLANITEKEYETFVDQSRSLGLARTVNRP
jgi:transcriptional regulator with XRE-family HTH domain